MKLLLAFLFVAVVIGLSSERMGPRTYGVILATSIATTVLYFGLRRFMV